MPIDFSSRRDCLTLGGDRSEGRHALYLSKEVLMECSIARSSSEERTCLGNTAVAVSRSSPPAIPCAGARCCVTAEEILYADRNGQDARRGIAVTGYPRVTSASITSSLAVMTMPLVSGPR
jgi:hypothetical protein